MMKRIRQFHLYLGMLFAPLVIFFAVSGALQTFNLQQSTKDGSYHAPAWIATLAEVHKDQRTVWAAGVHGSVALKWFIVLMAVGLMVVWDVIVGVIEALPRRVRGMRLQWSEFELMWGADRLSRGGKLRPRSPSSISEGRKPHTE